ncbi:MAG: carboxylesterase family protein [Pirellulaceae bacterium]
MIRWKRWAGSLACTVGLFASTGRCSAADDPKPEPGKQQAQKLERTVKVTMNYLLYLPKEYAQKDAWPLLLFLHGAGERGDDLDRVKVHGPPKLIAAGKEFPFLVVSPQCPNKQWWQPHELSALLDEIVEKYRVDPARIYVTGLSMGGFGTWSLAGFSPNRFAALVPICGGGDPQTVKRFAHLPVWAFHGAKDSVVPLAASERMVEALKKANGTVKFTVDPEADHDSWTAAYDNPELYTWLLAQQRASQEPAGKQQ